MLATAGEFDHLARDPLGMFRQQILRECSCPIDDAARPSGWISALALLKRHGFDFRHLFLETTRNPPRAPARASNEKPGAACRPGSWRSFGEYALLEDSRYTSQEVFLGIEGGVERSETGERVGSTMAWGVAERLQPTPPGKTTLKRRQSFGHGPS
jgi:hypothetical protein